MSDTPLDTELAVGRYLLHRQIARGGMATIHIARLMGDVGFSRIVAAKRLHPELAQDAEFVAMFLDEARIASKVHHRNVVPVLDVVSLGDEIVLVQEYVHGAPLSVLQRAAHQAQAPIPVPVACAIACDVLAGLHAAHETADELGAPLNIVHRDVSPQNILIATDGTARLLDFGVAKVELAGHVTRKGTFKGKLGYAPPEQIRGKATRQSDVYSLSVVLWELLVGRRLFGAVESEAELIGKIMAGDIPSVVVALDGERPYQGNYRWSQLVALAPLVAKGLARDAEHRWASAAEMAGDLAEIVTPATSSDVADWLRAVGKEFLDGRDKLIAAEEASYRRAARGTQVSSTHLSTVAGRSTQPTSPTVQRRKIRIVAGALIASIAIALATVAALHQTGEAHPSAAAATTQPPLPAVSASSAPAATAAATGTAAAAATGTGTGIGIGTENARTVEQRHIVHAIAHPAMKAPSPRAVVRAAPVTAPSPVVVPAPVAPPPPSAPIAKPDCATPYYFDGAKKVFKPECV